MVQAYQVPTKVKGRWTENQGTKDERKVSEKSYVVSSGKKGKRKFKKAVEKLGKKYNQDGVLIQRKGGGEAHCQRNCQRSMAW